MIDVTNPPTEPHQRAGPLVRFEPSFCIEQDHGSTLNDEHLDVDHSRPMASAPPIESMRTDDEKEDTDRGESQLRRSRRIAGRQGPSRQPEPKPIPAFRNSPELEKHFRRFWSQRDDRIKTRCRHCKTLFLTHMLGHLCRHITQKCNSISEEDRADFTASRERAAANPGRDLNREANLRWASIVIKNNISLRLFEFSLFKS